MFHQTIHGGCKIGPKVSLYADDLLLFVSDLDNAFPLVLNLLKEFGQISGYKLNFQKSELMPINAAVMAYPLSDLPFKTSLEHFKYLGVCVTENRPILATCSGLVLSFIL